MVVLCSVSSLGSLFRHVIGDMTCFQNIRISKVSEFRLPLGEWSRCGRVFDQLPAFPPSDQEVEAIRLTANSSFDVFSLPL
jgi:hypothetical protein